MHTMFNRVGGCVPYKYATSLREMYAAENGEDEFCGHYSKIPDNNIMFAAMYNQNMDDCHGIVIAGAPAKRFDGVATEAVGFQDERKQSLSVPPLPDIASNEEAALNRDSFVSQLVPGPFDDDVVCLQVVIFRLLSEHGGRLDGRDGSSPISIRHLFLSAVETQITRVCDIVYVRLTPVNTTEQVCIMDHVQHIYDKYSPGCDGRPRYVIAEGDQATYQHVLKAWRESFSLGEPGGLWDWLILLPGGSHIAKTGLNGIVRAASCGFGIEELAGVSGIADGNLKKWATLGHWRRVRRVLHHSTSAIGLEVLCTLLEGDPDCIAAAAPENKLHQSILTQCLHEAEVLLDRSAIK